MEENVERKQKKSTRRLRFIICPLCSRRNRGKAVGPWRSSSSPPSHRTSRSSHSAPSWLHRPSTSASPLTPLWEPPLHMPHPRPVRTRPPLPPAPLYPPALETPPQSSASCGRAAAAPRAGWWPGSCTRRTLTGGRSRWRPCGSGSASWSWTAWWRRWAVGKWCWGCTLRLRPPRTAASAAGRLSRRSELWPRPGGGGWLWQRRFCGLFLQDRKFSRRPFSLGCGGGDLALDLPAVVSVILTWKETRPPINAIEPQEIERETDVMDGEVVFVAREYERERIGGWGIWTDTWNRGNKEADSLLE